MSKYDSVDGVRQLFSEYYEVCVEQEKTIRRLKRQIDEMTSLAESDRKHINKLYEWIDRLIKTRKKKVRTKRKIKN